MIRLLTQQEKTNLCYCANKDCKKRFRTNDKRQKFCNVACRKANQNNARRVVDVHSECYMYIHLVYDKIPLAVKYGIELRGQGARLTAQKRGTCFDIERYGLWKFTSRRAAILAESACRELSEPILLPQDFSDGWSETTYLYNIDAIISTYEKYGGVLE